MKRSLHLLSAYMIAASLLFASCQSYYKVTNISSQTTNAKLDLLQQNGKYFVLRTADTAMQMKAISLKDDSTIQFVTDTLSEDHRLHLTNGRSGKLRYWNHVGTDSNVLKEVHFYAPSVKVLPGEQLNIPIKQVEKVELLGFDKKRTAKSKRRAALWVATGILTSLVVAGAVAWGSGPSSWGFSFK